MRLTTLMTLTATALMVLAPGGAAWADRVDFQSNDGLMRLEIARNGELEGEYPNRSGVLRGRVNAEGAAHGIWMQPRSDHPCRQARNGTNAWGTFALTGIYGRQPMGVWGYCDEQPNRDWRLRRQ